MKKILVITYYWPPSGGSGVQRWLKFVKYLRGFGIDPVVLTVNEKYATFPLLDQSLEAEIPLGIEVVKTKSKEPFQFYKKVSGEKSVPHSGFAGEKKTSLKGKIFKFIRGNFFIPDPRKGWNKFAYQEAERIIREKNIDCVITTSPPHSTQLIGLKLKQNLNIKWIADLRDPWTDIYYYKDLMHTAYARKKDLFYERQVLENADRILVVSKSIRDLFALKSEKMDASKIEIIPNGFDDADFEHVSVQPQKNENWTISYVGNIADSYRVETFVKAFSRLVKTRKDIAIRFVLVGNLPASVTKLIADEKVTENFEYVAYLPHKEAIQFLEKSDALLLAIPDVPNNRGILTGKLFEYLAVRKPIVCIGPTDGDAADIIAQADAGQCFGYNQDVQVFEYMNQLVDRWKLNSPSFSDNQKVQRFSRKSLTGKLTAVIQSL